MHGSLGHALVSRFLLEADRSNAREFQGREEGRHDHGAAGPEKGGDLGGLSTRSDNQIFWQTGAEWGSKHRVGHLLFRNGEADYLNSQKELPGFTNAITWVSGWPAA